MIEKLKGEIVLQPGFSSADCVTIFQEAMEDAEERGYASALVYWRGEFGWEASALWLAPVGDFHWREPDHLQGLDWQYIAIYLQHEDGGLYFIGPFEDDDEDIDGVEA